MSTTATNAPGKTTTKYVVHIVEFPRDDELVTGRQQEREPLQSVLQQSGIQANTYLAINAKSFAQAFLLILSSHEKGTVPILHLSGHGNGHGIGFASGESLTWAQLGEGMETLNKVLDGGLLLCMSTCEGIGALSMVASEKHEPFHTLVGPGPKVGWSDSLVAFVTFYHLVITKGMEPRAATKVMSQAAGLPEGTFLCATGEGLRGFHTVVRQMKEAARTEEFARAIKAAFAKVR